MKATNHHKDNYTYDDTSSGSVMNGTIKMTRKEYKDAIAFLKNEYKKAKQYNYTATRDGLMHTIDWVLNRYGDKRRICLGVTATELIFRRYRLPNYKRQNYVIEISD